VDEVLVDAVQECSGVRLVVKIASDVSASYSFQRILRQMSLVGAAEPRIPRLQVRDESELHVESTAKQIAFTKRFLCLRGRLARISGNLGEII
jgi:hypothetical protein